MLSQSLTYSDILIKPKFSTIRSRSEVSLDHTFLGMSLGLPLISANMDTVTSPLMASTLSSKGALSSLHRFQSIEDNIKQFHESIHLGINSNNICRYNRKPVVSFGVGNNEYERALALVEAGAETLLLDVAHGAALHVVEQYDRVRSKVGNNVNIIVGNFDNYDSLDAFMYHIKSGCNPNAFKIGIGPGSACTTRVVTGCGGGMVTALLDCSRASVPLIADGGAKTSGDIAKALACGASSVMVGSMIAGTDEVPGELVSRDGLPMHPQGYPDKYKKYRGSASSESYEVQGKSEGRTAEGESMLIPYKGPVSPILDSISNGLKSSFSYVGAKNVQEFKEKAEIVQVTQNTFQENFAHGKNQS